MEKEKPSGASKGPAGRIRREIGPGEYQLGYVCAGLQSVAEVKKLLEERGLDEQFVIGTKVLVDDTRDFYMYVDDREKRLVACLGHIRDSEQKTVYLDFLHELVHIFQLYDGRNLYDRRYKYVRRSTEIEAYSVAVNEGRRMGMSEKELMDYLLVEWISEDEHRELAESVGIDTAAID